MSDYTGDMSRKAHIAHMQNNVSQEVNDANYPPPIPIRVLRQGVNVPLRQVLAAGGFAMIVLSVPSGILTPHLPVGLPIAVIGAVLLGRNAVWGRQWLSSVLKRHPKFEEAMPGWIVQLSLGRRKHSRAG
jgi:hypothetical protein